MAPFPDDKEKRRWRVKDSSFSPWRDLPGTYTAAEIWEMLNRGRFADAMLAEEPPAKTSTADE